jgi:hypothetical protein
MYGQFALPVFGQKKKEKMRGASSSSSLVCIKPVTANLYAR